MSQGPTTTPPEARCHNCGRVVPPGRFCAVCGSRLDQQNREAVVRRSHFAAHPNERVIALWLVSALLPHLPHRRQSTFRLALALAVALLALFGLLGVNAAAVAFAAASVPCLYFIYLWEVEVYEDHPLPVAAILLGGGVVLGVLWARFTGSLTTSSVVIQRLVTGVQGGTVLQFGVAEPVAQQVVMLLPALAMLAVFRRRFTEGLDGFTFGAAGALGFTLGATLVDLLPVFETGQVSIVDPLVNMVQVLERGFLVPVINASTTGLIGATVWLLRGRRRADVAHPAIGLPAAAAIALAAQVVVALTGTLTGLVWVAALVALVVALILIVTVRSALHHLLLAEAAQVGEAGPPFTCPHCRHLVPRLAFCPNCGVAIRATSKRGHGRLARGVR